MPPDDYLKAARKLCTEHNVLFIADEIQTGLGRCGKMLACDYAEVKPDVLILGKALSGGFYPISVVLTSKEIMLCFKPGEHGSTFGGNPLACAIGMEALQIIIDEGLVANSHEMGMLFRKWLNSIEFPFIREIRGKGLLNAIEIDEGICRYGLSAFDICLLMKENGLLAKPTRNNIIRFAPPLCISKSQIEAAVEIIKKSFGQFQDLIKKRKSSYLQGVANSYILYFLIGFCLEKNQCLRKIK